jgi:hypothetical protein
MPYGINYEQILNSLVVKPVRAVLLFNFGFFKNFVPMCLCISVTILKSCGPWPPNLNRKTEHHPISNPELRRIGESIQLVLQGRMITGKRGEVLKFVS